MSSMRKQYACFVLAWFLCAVLPEAAAASEGSSFGRDLFPVKAEFTYLRHSDITYHTFYKELDITIPAGNIDADKSDDSADGADEGERKKYLLVQRGYSVPSGYPSAQVIWIPLERAAVLSGELLPFFSELEEEAAVAAVRSFDDVLTVQFVEAAENGTLLELGGEGEAGNSERMHPEALSAVFSRELRDWDQYYPLNVPTAVTSPRFEVSPLARAEWIKVAALFFNKEEQARERFSEVEEAYLQLQDLLESLSLSDADDSVYADFFLPASNQDIESSNESRYWSMLLDDAGLTLNEKFMPAENQFYLLRFNGPDDLNEEQTAVQQAAEQETEFRTLFAAGKRVNAYGINDIRRSGLVHPEWILRDILIMRQLADLNLAEEGMGQIFDTYAEELFFFTPADSAASIRTASAEESAGQQSAMTAPSSESAPDSEIPPDGRPISIKVRPESFEPADAVRPVFSFTDEDFGGWSSSASLVDVLESRVPGLTVLSGTDVFQPSRIALNGTLDHDISISVHGSEIPAAVPITEYLESIPLRAVKSIKVYPDSPMLIDTVLRNSWERTVSGSVSYQYGRGLMDTDAPITHGLSGDFGIFHENRSAYVNTEFLTDDPLMQSSRPNRKGSAFLGYQQDYDADRGISMHVSAAASGKEADMPEPAALNLPDGRKTYLQSAGQAGFRYLYNPIASLSVDLKGGYIHDNYARKAADPAEQPVNDTVKTALAGASVKLQRTDEAGILQNTFSLAYNVDSALFRLFSGGAPADDEIVRFDHDAVFRNEIALHPEGDSALNTIAVTPEIRLGWMSAKSDKSGSAGTGWFPHLSWKTGLMTSLLPEDKLVFKISGGTSFSTPNTDVLFGLTSQLTGDNPSFSSEKKNSAMAEFIYAPSPAFSTTVGGQIFRTHNALFYDPYWTRTAANLGTVQGWGGSAGASYTSPVIDLVDSRLRLRGSYSYLHTEQQPTGNPILLQPEHTAEAVLQINHAEGHKLSAAGKFQSSRFTDINEQKQNEIPVSVDLTVSAAVRLGNDAFPLTVTALADNLLNASSRIAAGGIKESSRTLTVSAEFAYE